MGTEGFGTLGYEVGGGMFLRCMEIADNGSSGHVHVIPRRWWFRGLRCISLFSDTSGLGVGGLLWRNFGLMVLECWL